MRVIRLPEGSRTRSITVTVDGERVSVDFKRDGTANVGNERAKKLCRAIPMLSLVESDDEESDVEDEEQEED